MCNGVNFRHQVLTKSGCHWSMASSCAIRCCVVRPLLACGMFVRAVVLLVCKDFCVNVFSTSVIIVAHCFCFS